MDLISIICPVKNEELYIKEMIDSVINQSYENWELIIVDDHSNDKTKKIISTFHDDRIHYYTNRGIGIIEAIKTAFKFSGGKYITRMDGDDLMPINKLKILYELHNNQSKIIATGLVKYFSNKPVSEGYLKYENWLNEVSRNNFFHENIYRECVVASANWLCLKEDLILIGFPHEIKYPEDYDMIFKCYEHNFIFKAIDEITHFWREHPERTSRNSIVYDQKSFFKLKVEYWLQLEHKINDEIIILGNNQKTKEILKNIPQTFKVKVLTLNDSEIDNKQYFSFFKFKLNPINHKLLVAVYPPLKQRIKIINNLENKGFINGKNYWFL